MSLPYGMLIGGATRMRTQDYSTFAPGAPAAAGYVLREASTRDEVMALRAAWDGLEAASEGSTAFQSVGFCLPWLEAYCWSEAPSHRARLLAVEDGAGTLMALAPLAEKRSGLVHMAEWIGEPLIQYGDILLHPAADRSAVRRALSDALDRWHVHGLHLRNVRADSRIGRVLDLAGRQMGEPVQAAFCDMAALGGMEALLKRMSASTRKTGRLKRRRLEERGTLRFAEVRPGIKGRALCELALHWKRQWLAERGLSSRAFLDPRALATVVDMASRDEADNPMRLYVLSLDEVPIAIEISLVDRAATLAFMGMYCPDHEELSPGRVQMEFSIRHGFEEGWPGYDLLAPLTDYKRSFSTGTVAVADYMLPATLLGLAYRDLFLRGLRPAAKRLLMALPATLRGRLLRQGASYASL